MLLFLFFVEKILIFFLFFGFVGSIGATFPTELPFAEEPSGLILANASGVIVVCPYLWKEKIREEYFLELLGFLL